MNAKLLIIALVPAMIALGHDAFLFYMNQDNPVYAEGDVVRFFASFGFIWTTYHPESYKTVVRTVSPETWSIINMILTQKAFFAGLTLAAIIYAVTMVLWVFGIGRPDPLGEGYSERSHRLMKKHEKLSAKEKAKRQHHKRN